MLMRSANAEVEPMAQQLPDLTKNRAIGQSSSTRLGERESERAREARTAVLRDVLVARGRRIVRAVDVAPVP